LENATGSRELPVDFDANYREKTFISDCWGIDLAPRSMRVFWIALRGAVLQLADDESRPEQLVATTARKRMTR
jgi:hypothetical protein